MIFKQELIAYSVPQMGLSSLSLVLKKALSGKVYQGEDVTRFEREFAKYIGTKHAVAFASGRYCLYLLYNFWGCSGKKVLVPSYTCIPAIDGARWAGAEPVFMDIDLDTYNPKLNPQLEKTKNLGAICLSYLYGVVGNIEPLLKLAQERQIPVIEDAAICMGGMYQNQKVGSLGDAAIFSLQSSKIITAWRGGVITTNNDKLYCFLKEEQHKLKFPQSTKLIFNLAATYARRILSHPNFYGLMLYPIKKVLSSRYFGWFLEKIMEQNPLEAVDGLSPLEIPDSEKYRFTNLQAAIALELLKKADASLGRRCEVVKMVINGLREVPDVKFPVERAGCKNVYGRFPLRITGMSKLKLEKELLKRGIETALYYPYICPNTEHMKKYNFNPNDYPNASLAARETILLPAYGYLREKDARMMIEAIKEIAGKRLDD